MTAIRRLCAVAAVAAVGALAAQPLQARDDGLAPSSYGFTVGVSLSPKAAALLSSRHEGIVVSAMYSGEPIPGKTSKADEEGMIELGSEDVTIPGMPGRAVVTGTKFMVNHVGWVKTPMVLINVYSARRSSQDNLLDCGIFEDSVAKAQAAPVAIACKVIGEP